MSSPSKAIRTFVAFVAVACTLRGAVGVGDRFPPLAEIGPGARGLPETSAKVVLVDFWASWCAPCKASFPVFSKLHEEFIGRGLVIVAVGVDERAAAYDGFLKRLSPPFATVHDAEKRLVRMVEVPAMPTSYLLDRSGTVRFVHRGFHGSDTESQLRRDIETLLNEKE